MIIGSSEEFVHSNIKHVFSQHLLHFFFFFNTEEKMKVLEWKALSGAASFQSCSVVVVGGDVCICSLVFCDLRTMDSP